MKLPQKENKLRAKTEQARRRIGSHTAKL